MTEIDLNHFNQLVNDTSYAYVALHDRNNKVTIPYNSKSVPFGERVKQINKFLTSSATPDAVYLITFRNNHREPPTQYKIVKNTSGHELNDQEIIILPSDSPKQTTLVTDRELLELRVNVERLTMENNLLSLENEQLRDEIDYLTFEQEEAIALADETPIKVTIFEQLFNGFKEIAPSLADNYFQIKKEELEIRRAELGLEQMKLTKSPPPPPPVQSELENNAPPTLEEMLQFKSEYPAEFFEWLSSPQNRQYFNELSGI
jgi:hypothetical protein